MNFERPINTLKQRVMHLKSLINISPEMKQPFGKIHIEELKREREEHERAIEFLDQIKHISTK